MVLAPKFSLFYLRGAEQFAQGKGREIRNLTSHHPVITTQSLCYYFSFCLQVAKKRMFLCNLIFCVYYYKIFCLSLIFKVIFNYCFISTNIT